MAKVLDDPRVKDSMDGDELADVSRMRYGGFAS